MHLAPLFLLPLLPFITALPQRGPPNDGEMAAIGLDNLQYPTLKVVSPPELPSNGHSPSPPPIQTGSPISLSDLQQNANYTISLPSTKSPSNLTKGKVSFEIDISGNSNGGENIEIYRYHDKMYHNNTRGGGRKKQHLIGTATGISIPAHTQPLGIGPGGDSAFPAQTGGPAHVRVPTPDHRPPGFTGP